MKSANSFTVESRCRSNIIHLGLAGDFDESAAITLADTVQRLFLPGGRMFIATEGLGKVSRAGRESFARFLGFSGVPAEAVYYKGEKAVAIAPEGSKVITVRRSCKCGCGCGKKCSDCACRKKKQQELKG